VPERDWVAWHEPYEDPDSPHSWRLRTVQRRLADALDACGPGPITLVSLCAGQGRDVIGVLPGHPRRDDVRARLVELDPRNVERARADAAGLTGVDVVGGDASLTSHYGDVVPADVVLACGIFGNVPDDDIASTVRHLPMFCAPGATVLWTRHTKPPDLTPAIRQWFRDAGFDEVAFDAERLVSVGTNRSAGGTVPFDPDVTLFTFV
jgi:hypothetical protein